MDFLESYSSGYITWKYVFTRTFFSLFKLDKGFCFQVIYSHREAKMPGLFA